MRNHQHTLLQVREIFLQPLHGVQVQVVGRLVQQQVVGMSEQGLGQHDTHLLVVRYLGHLLVVLTFLHTQVLQQLCCLTLCFPAVHLGKSHLQIGCTHTVFLGHLSLGIQGFTLLHVLPQGLMTHQHGVHHRIFVIFEVVLLQHAQALARLHLYGPLVGL